VWTFALAGTTVSLRNAAEDSDVASMFEANTAEAISHGAWGVPSMVVDGELFWDQDRVEFVERRLAK
jgi:2-hydroxychromene-2-carboxylate isomerase